MAVSLKTVAIRLAFLVSFVSFALLYLIFRNEREAMKALNQSELPGSISIRDLSDSTIPEAPEDFNTSSKKYQLFQYSYQNSKSNGTHKGKVMHAPKWILRKHKLPIKYLDSLTPKNVDEFAFVMGCTADHYNESKDAIATIQMHFPKHPILYYDWGLEPQQIKELKTLCGVTHKPFNLSRYPATHKQSGRAKYQSAKIFCIMDAFIDHSGVFWLDASIRFVNASTFAAVYRGVVKNGGFAYMSTTEHSSYSVTHPGMYGFLPTDMDVQKKLYQGVTYAVLMYKTRKVFDNIVWWWFLCALHSECMTPILNLGCNFKNNDMMNTFADCHRFDQSASNILASNLYDYNDNEYIFNFIKNKHAFEVMRDSSGMYTPRVC